MLIRMALASTLAVFALHARAGKPQTVTLDIKGMTCPTCPLTVKVALKKQPGVTDVKVNLPRNTAEVTFDPDQVSVERLAKASTDAGYPATAAK